MNELDALKQRVTVLENLMSVGSIERQVMHRALIRCQARCHILAEPPTGWSAVWLAVKNLVYKGKSEEQKPKKRAKEKNELLEIMSNGVRKEK